jgi:hypothetical protein
MRIHTVGLTGALCVLGMAVGLAADPQLGTWKLNQANSKLKGTARNHRGWAASWCTSSPRRSG